MKKHFVAFLLILGLSGYLTADDALYISFHPAYFAQTQEAEYNRYDGLCFEFRMEFGSLERQENWWLGIGLLSKEYKFSPAGDMATFTMIPFSFGWGYNLKFTSKTALKFKIGMFGALCTDSYVSPVFNDEIFDVVPGVIAGISLRVFQTSRFFGEIGCEYQYGFLGHKAAYIENSARMDSEIRLEGIKFGINIGFNAKEPKIKETKNL